MTSDPRTNTTWPRTMETHITTSACETRQYEIPVEATTTVADVLRQVLILANEQLPQERWGMRLADGVLFGPFSRTTMADIVHSGDTAMFFNWGIWKAGGFRIWGQP